VTVSVGGNNASTTYGGVLAGNGGIIKVGTGTLRLTGATTYTGNTTVGHGTLELVNPVLATNSTVTVADGATLVLDFMATNKVKSLVLNGVNQPPGVYGSTTRSSFFGGSGSLLVEAPVATNPTNIVARVSGRDLVLSWPVDHIGWHLQSQTNALGKGLGANWADVPDTAAGNRFTNTMNPADGSVFYRLIYQ